MGNDIFVTNTIQNNNYDKEKMKQFKTNSFVLNYNLVNSLNDNLYGEIKLFRNLKNKLIINFNNVFEKENDFIKYWFFWLDRSSLKNHNVVKIIDFIFNKKYSYKNNLQLDIFCEYLGIDLQSDIHYRKLINKKFSSNEIYHLAKSVIYGLDYFYKNKLSRNFVLKSKYINYDKDFNIKINDLIKNQYDIFNVYRPPEININFLERLNTNDDGLNFNLEKISKLNSFILGIICLELGTFYNIRKIYATYNFNEEYFLLIKEQFIINHKNDKKLISLVEDMINLKADKRSTIQELKEKIDNFKSKKLKSIKKKLTEQNKNFDMKKSIFKIK